MAGTIFLMLELSKETYSARIIDRSDGSPVQGAVVEIEKITYDEMYFYSNDMIPTTREHVRTVHTDSDGRFSVRLPGVNEDRGYYRFKISAVGYVPDHVPGYEYPENGHSYMYSDEMESVVFFNSVCILNGNVTDTSGDPIPDATVVFWPDVINFYGHDVDQAAATNVDGSYSLKYLRAGSGTVQVSAPNYERKKIRFLDLNGSETNNLNVVLERIISNGYKVSGNISSTHYWAEFDIDNSRILLAFSSSINEQVDRGRFFTMVEDLSFEIYLDQGTYNFEGVYLGHLNYNAWFEVYAEDSPWGYRTISVYDDVVIDLEAHINYAVE
jgi:5-hydroxyisourate hydrolase-like protein (transthyretin family)